MSKSLEQRDARWPSREPRELEPWSEQLRYDAAEKVVGGVEYVADIPTLQDEGRVVMVRSPYGHARIVGVDSSVASRQTGVLGILDRNSLEGIAISEPISEYMPEGGAAGEAAYLGGTHVIATEKALFDGDIVAMVAATDLDTALRAAELIEIDYEPLPEVTSFEAAMADNSPVLHDALGSNVAVERQFDWGDIDKGFHEADLVIEGTYFGGNVFHHPMEPPTPFIVKVSDGEADVWTSIHAPFMIPPHFERILGIKRENVRVRMPPMGGGFGAKQTGPELLGAAVLAERSGRPLRYLPTEEEGFRTTVRHAIEYRGKIGLKRDGTITALDVELDVDTGAYFTGAELVAHVGCLSAWGCYRIPNYRVRAQAAFTNKTPAGAFRGTGRIQTTFGIESLIDEAAAALGRTPLSFRKQNALKRGEYIADSWRVDGVTYLADTMAIDTDFEELLDHATRAIGWDQNDEVLPGRETPVNGRRRLVRGKGLALSLRHGAQAGGRAQVEVEVSKDGSFSVRHNAVELGNGVYTMLAVVCSRALGVSQDVIRVTDPDTGNRLHSPGTTAQKTTVQVGNAAKSACEKLVDELLEAASQVRGEPTQQWRFEEGHFWLDDDSYSFSEIMELLPRHEAISAVGAFSNPSSDEKAFGGVGHWAPGAAAVEVEVDVDTGRCTLIAVGLVADAGRAIHPTSAVRQVEGGAILGIGAAMFEDLVYEQGMLVNGNIVDYRMPLMTDMPEVLKTVLVEKGDGPGPFGSKGMSQTSLPCIAPAIANAIADATGVRIRSTPFAPERVARAIGSF